MRPDRAPTSSQSEALIRKSPKKVQSLSDHFLVTKLGKPNPDRRYDGIESRPPAKKVFQPVSSAAVASTATMGCVCLPRISSAAHGARRFGDPMARVITLEPRAKKVLCGGCGRATWAGTTAGCVRFAISPAPRVQRSPGRGSGTARLTTAGEGRVTNSNEASSRVIIGRLKDQGWDTTWAMFRWFVQWHVNTPLKQSRRSGRVRQLRPRRTRPLFRPWTRSTRAAPPLARSRSRGSLEGVSRLRGWAAAIYAPGS